MAVITIKGHEVLIDDEDLDRVSKHNWYIIKIGYVYSSRMTNRKVYGQYLHRFLVDAKKGQIVDHINHDPFDNRKANLRIASQSQNQMNRSRNKNNKSGFKGVNKMEGRWYAKICKDGKHYALGGHPSPEAAHAAYCAKAKELFGEFARFE